MNELYGIIDDSDNHCVRLCSRKLYHDPGTAIDAMIKILREDDSCGDAEIRIFSYGFEFTDRYDSRFTNRFRVRIFEIVD